MPLSISSSEAPADLRGNTALRALVVTLVLSLLLLAGATEWLVRTQVVPQDTFGKHLRLLQTTTQSNASFGDSHVARGFDASGGFVNLAYPSENIEYMFWKMRKQFDAHPAGRVIVQADPHLFAPYRVNASFRPYNDNEQFKSPALYSATARHRPQLVAYWSAFLNGFGKLESKVQQTENGALLSQGDLSALPLRKRQIESRLRVQNHRLEQSQAVVAAQVRYLEMISFLIEKGAQICLVSFPVSPDYLTALAEADQQATPSGHAKIIQFFEETAAQKGARYVDARAQVTKIALFRDVDHLNAEGAGVFSGSLIRQCFEG
jgi:hypothetical protein